MVSNNDRLTARRAGIAAGQGSTALTEVLARDCRRYLSPHEIGQIRTEYHEGLRNYAPHQGHVDRMLSFFDSIAGV